MKEPIRTILPEIEVVVVRGGEAVGEYALWEDTRFCGAAFFGRADWVCFGVYWLNPGTEWASLDMARIFFPASYLVLAILAGWGLVMVGVVVNGKKNWE